ncbi:MAG: flagellar biosynthetic protein FliR [Caulobacteraceae bacterium]
MSPFGLPIEIYHAALVFLRVGSVVMLMPAISDTAVPPRIRLGFALLLSLCLGAIANPYLPPMPQTVGEMGGQVFKELFIGLGLGALLNMMMNALAVAGEIMSIQTTLAFSQTANPNEAQPGASITSFLSVTAVALLFATNLDHLFIGAIARSYQLFPPMKPPAINDAAFVAVRAVSAAFALGLQLAAPIVVFSIVFNVAAGLIGRLMPQFQIFFAVTPLTVLLGLSILMVSVGTIGMVWMDRYRAYLAQFS